MYKIYYYKDCQKNMQEYINDLKSSNNKENNIKLNKIIKIFHMLEENGINLPKQYIKQVRHIDKNLWKIRILRERIFFVHYNNEKIVILHSFLKKTQKTPENEKKKAKKELNDVFFNFKINSSKLNY